MRRRHLGLLVAALLLPVGCGQTTGEPAASPSAGTEPSASISLPSVAATDPPPTPTPAAAGCPPGGLLLLAGPTDAALGLRVTPLQVRNCGSRDVTLGDYPDLVVEQDGRPATGYTTAHGGTMVDPGPAAVVLRPGQRAWSSLAWRNTLAADGTVPIAGDTIVVRDLGGVTQSVRALVDLGTTGRIEVTAWQRDRPRSRA